MMNKDNTSVDLYYVIGNPVEHSRSPLIHKMFAEQLAQNLLYETKLVPLNQFEKEILSLDVDSVKGLNVTVPFKQDAFQAAEILSNAAKLAGAVNTLTFKNGSVYGDNTDGIGLVKDLTANNDFDLSNKKILILGAGGAVRGVLQPIIEQAPASITIANRTVSKAIDIAEIYADLFQIEACEYSDLKQCYDLIINGTSASLSNDLPPVDTCIINSDSYVYDMMYGSNVTVFNEWALKNGVKCAVDGLGMLVEQAAESFYIWRGVRPATKQVIQQLRQSL